MSRIGVFVCHCGLNIAKTVRVSELAQFASTLPDVVVAKDYKFMCSTPGQEMIANDIKEHKLDRVIVSACSPLMHEQTFRKVEEEVRFRLAAVAQATTHVQDVEGIEQRAG